MATYDDRPISVYDNLNMPTNTSKSKTQSVMPLTTSQTSINETATIPTKTTTHTTTTCSPYADISFKFNDSHLQQNKQELKEQQQLQQQQQQQQSYLHSLPSSNHNLIPTLNQLNPTTMESNLNNYTYAIPFKPAITLTTTTTTTGTTPILSAESAQQQTAVAITSPAVRPLSQHSQSELNEATSQSIAAVKAALHDAKSKFFGLNGYASNENLTNNNYTFESPTKSIVYDFNNIQPNRPKVQILTPPPKPQPKYQNIPENSAIFRNLIPPERPPKPIHYQSSISNAEPNSLSAPSASASPSPNSSRPTELQQQQQTAVKMDLSDHPSTSANASTSRNYTAYQQIPLNDDCASPSQAVYMTTTVPQNIKGSKIAGRHTPTRNSLRHSRMLVINNKNYQDNDHPNPMHFKCPNLARWLLFLQIFLGFLIAILSIFIFILAPNTPIQENPFYSGLVLLIAGILGLYLIRFRRIKREKFRDNCFIFLRADSYFTSLAAVLLCCVAMIFAAIHFARLTANDTICESSNILEESASCLCMFNAPREILEAPVQNFTFDDAVWLTNGKDIKQNTVDPEDHSYKFEYRDLNCKEVTCDWTVALGFSVSLNGLGLIVSFIYIVLLACYRYNTRRLYTSVQTSTF